MNVVVNTRDRSPPRPPDFKKMPTFLCRHFCFLYLFYMEDQLLELLKEAYDQLREMWKVADDSVADYTLMLEVAMRFSEKAFRTKDRLDIFKALQKAHDALEKEYDETPKDEEYDDLVDRLALALNGGLNERIKPSEVKRIITEAVLDFLNNEK